MLSTLPPELLEKITVYLSKKDLKSLCLVSTLCCRVCRIAIWAAPRFRRRMGAERLLSLIHLPIKELHTKDLDNYKNNGGIMEVLVKMKSLSVICVDEPLSPVDLKSLQQLGVSLVVHARALGTIPVEKLTVLNK